MRFNIDNTIAIAVDFQERLIPAMYQSEELIDKTSKLIKGLKVLGIPIVFTQQYTKGLGMTDERIQIKDEDGYFKYFDKVTFSCCGDSSIQEELKGYNRKNYIVFGIESHICVLQTLVDLLEDEETCVYLVCDCVSSREKYNKEIALRRAEQEGAYLTTYESILFELLKTAKADQFKEVSKIIK